MNSNNVKSYRVFTIASGQVTEGAVIDTLHLKGAGIDIPAIIIGEEGRGRERGILPVQLTDGQYKEWQEKRCVQIQFAEVGTTKAGKPKLFAKNSASTDEKIICVFRTKIGFRGGNSHTGDRAGWKCSKYGCDASGEGNAPETCPKCGANGWDGPKIVFKDFPGQIIVKGYIAQGAAGRMGGGEQIIALIPKNVVFRTSYSGRLYGAPGSHYYKWDGSKLLAATWDERAATDLF
jgi:hypothetical protein